MATDPARPVTGYPAATYYSNGYPPPQPSYPNRPPLTSLPFVRAFIAGIIVIFVVIAVILFIIWLVLRPHLPDFRVDSLQLTNFSLPSQSLSAFWVVGFSVFNPNKKTTIAYDNIQSSIFYKSELLAETRIVPFDQGKRNLTSVTASFSSTNLYVDGWVVRDIDGDRARGTVSFNVKVLARVGLRAGGWRTRRRLLRVLCMDVAVGISNSTGSGKLVGGSRDCRVDI